MHLGPGDPKIKVRLIRKVRRTAYFLGQIFNHRTTCFLGRREYKGFYLFFLSKFVWMLINIDIYTKHIYGILDESNEGLQYFRI